MNKILTFTDRQAFREWFDKYGTESTGIWILFGKKKGKLLHCLLLRLWKKRFVTDG
jgi:uncharacterized protein YdeI (YjbR/CyaY-like superfamily)